MKPQLKPGVLALLFAGLWTWSAPSARAEIVVYEQPPSGSGGLYHSSWWDPDGSDYDQYVWDAFTLSLNRAVTRIEWRGGFDPVYGGSGGPVIDFTVAIYPSIPAGTQPDVVHPPLVEYQTGGNAGQTLAGTFGGVPMYDYTFTLPTPFQATAGTRYWVQIEAWQHGIPDWAMTVGTGGDGTYFRRIAYVGDIFYQIVPGDTAFRLLAQAAGIAGDPTPPFVFSLDGVLPNPSRGDRLSTSFVLPTDAPVRLELIDVSGRRVLVREVGVLGAGRHAVDLSGGHRLAAGEYFVRLLQGANVRAARVVVVR